jgi:hydrogenase maturation protein HypF
LIKIQHHHAHIASGMAENGLDEKVIGVAFDGTGLGTDGNILGSEFLVCDYQSFQRIMHFEYIPLPGGDKSNEEPWRIAVSLLYKYFGNDFLNRKLPFLSKVPDEKLNIIIQMIDNKLNCPLSSGAGRLFDAMAAMFNICTHSTFHAEAPMRLESLIDKNCKAFYNFQFDKTISFLPMFIEVLEDIEKKKDIGILSAKFHNTMINCIFDTVVKISEESGINKAVLSGGVFQNRYLLGNLENLFDKHPNIQLFTHKSIPSGDGGIALGQLAIAAKQFNQYA